ncbi:hypothetical protein [Mycobacterium uberis]|uniref:hypothetical protein n=1 Tax=Mycobacterium uberis TaxID=2162698 RepID=UPI001A9EBC66|nr:hypothetical protein [Mycobacterium uberis]
MHQVSSVLDAAHAAGAMRYDMKLGNILTTTNNSVYLVDCGIANMVTDEKLT